MFLLECVTGASVSLYPEVSPCGSVIRGLLICYKVCIPVSYTHLDVYKRQMLLYAGVQILMPLFYSHACVLYLCVLDIKTRYA